MTARFLVFPVAALILASSVFAQTPTTENSQDLRDSVKQKVEEELSQIQQAVSKKAFLGSITSKNEAAINLNTYRGEPRQTLVTTDTAIKLKTGRDGTPKDLNVGDYLLVMGDVDSKNIMTAKRLLVIPAPGEDNRQVDFGKVTAVSSGSITIQTAGNKTVTAKLLSSTSVSKIQAGASVKAKIADIQTGASVVMITKSAASASVTNLQIVAAPSPTATAAPTSTP
jgi:hypothetical protein